MLLAFYVGGEFGPDELREMALAGSFILIFLFNKIFLYIRFIDSLLMLAIIFLLVSSLMHLILWKILKLILVAPSGEEEEVHAMIQECLALRVKYVYRENVAPWMKETIPESDTPKMDHDPFRFDDVEPTAVSCFSTTCYFHSLIKQNG